MGRRMCVRIGYLPPGAGCWQDRGFQSQLWCLQACHLGKFLFSGRIDTVSGDGEHVRVLRRLDRVRGGHHRPASLPVPATRPAPMPWEPPVMTATLSVMTPPAPGRSGAGQRALSSGRSVLRRSRAIMLAPRVAQRTRGIPGQHPGAQPRVGITVRGRVRLDQPFPINTILPRADHPFCTPLLTSSGGASAAQSGGYVRAGRGVTATLCDPNVRSWRVGHVALRASATWYMNANWGSRCLAPPAAACASDVPHRG
jgi:hypothetical protein